MEDILDKHKQDFDEVRRLCLLCHGLDLTTSKLFTSSTYKDPSKETKSILHSMLSSALLNLAVSIRINLYQEVFENRLIPMDTMAATIYEDHDLVIKPLTIKDVCDKIIHADSVTKAVFPENLLDQEVHVSIQFKGKLGKKNWTMDLCLDLFAEHVLSLLDEIEGKFLTDGNSK